MVFPRQSKVGPSSQCCEGVRVLAVSALTCESGPLLKLHWASVSHCELWGRNKALDNPLFLSQSWTPFLSLGVSVSAAYSYTL